MRNNPIPGREPRELKRERMRELRMREEAELFRQIAAAQEAQRRRSEADARAYDLLLNSLSRGQKLGLKLLVEANEERLCEVKSYMYDGGNDAERALFREVRQRLREERAAYYAA